jgi:hypothetical protein
MPIRGWRAILASCLAPFVLLVWGGTAAADPVVARQMGDFYQVFLGRGLSREEVRKLTDEYIALHAAMGRSPEAIREKARAFGARAKVLGGDPSGPAAFMLRHLIIERSYFDPPLQKLLHLKLLTEPDPVRVVDGRSRRLMTERDVIALANIHRFGKSEGPPRHRDLSRQQIEELVSSLKAAVGGNTGMMPRFFGEAAAFWAGVQKAWPELDAEQRKVARAYAAKTWRIQIPPRMYGILWGLEPRAATSRYADDVGERINRIVDINMRLGNLPRVMDAIFGP